MQHVFELPLVLDSGDLLLGVMPLEVAKILFLVQVLIFTDALDGSREGIGQEHKFLGLL